MGDYTRKHADLFGGNVKQISRVITPTAAAQYIGAAERKIQIVGASFTPDATGSSPTGVLGVYAGPNAASHLGGASPVLACADSATQSGNFVVGTAKFYRTIATPANALRNRGDSISVGMPSLGGTWPAGTVTVYYVDQDVDPNP